MVRTREGNMTKALIGYSGFVGSTLLKQASFDYLYRSTNINKIKGKSFSTIVCAGASAQKWMANREPDADQKNIEGLIENLKHIECKMFILISTVDVFKNPVKVYENSTIDIDGLHAYGLNRYKLENFVRKSFPRYLIVRLPGLVGPKLRKNVLYDLLNENNLLTIDSRSIYQFYPMVNLWYDIQVALDSGLQLIHLTAKPISVSDVARTCFGKIFNNSLPATPAEYDMRTRYANIFDGTDSYQYNERESIQAIRAYVQSEQQNFKFDSGLGV